MDKKDKILYLLKEEVIYLFISLGFGIMTYINHGLPKSFEMFLYTYLFFQLIILISNWGLIFKNKNKL
ncbi:hypothetical protein CWC24_07020 [Pseudoalteromonas ruthenica]|nr:hypothetical protein CWC24_07020 [Pseudoalteromonas ruthenica]TMO52782.1 hypothetical protein CWC23_01915 [Pseudoalteromonas ruthenica]